MPKRKIKFVPHVVEAKLPPSVIREKDSQAEKICSCIGGSCKSFSNFASGDSLRNHKRKRRTRIQRSGNLRRPSDKRTTENSVESEADSIPRALSDDVLVETNGVGVPGRHGEPEICVCVIALVDGSWLQGRLMVNGVFQPLGLFGTAMENADPEDYMDRCIIDAYDPPTLYNLQVIDFTRKRKMQFATPLAHTGGDSARLRSTYLDFQCSSFHHGEAAEDSLNKYFPSLGTQSDLVVCFGECSIFGEFSAFVEAARMSVDLPARNDETFHIRGSAKTSEQPVWSTDDEA